MQVRGSKPGGALRLSLPCESSVVIPGNPSARQRTSLVRLTHGLKLNTGQWLLRFSVLRETPMTSTFSFPFQKAKMLPFLLRVMRTGEALRGLILSMISAVSPARDLR